MFCVVAIKGLCKRGAEGCASQCAHFGNFCTEVRRAHSPRGKRRARGALIRDIAIEDGRALGNGAFAEPADDRVKEDTPAERLMAFPRSEEHTSELQSLMRRSDAATCWKKKTNAQSTYCN